MKLSVVMSTLNEEKAVGKVIADIKKATDNKAEIVVVDSSTDKTPEIAEKLGARVIRQPPRGYGMAYKTGLLAAKGDIIITIDCDDTYPAEMIPEFVRLIEEEGYDVVVGSRLAKKTKHMPLLNKFGNWLFSFLTSTLYGVKTTDVHTGMRAYRRRVIHSIKWDAEPYTFPVELLVKSVRNEYKFTEIPIDYKPRIGEVTIKRFQSGLATIWFILKYRFSKI